MILRLPKGYRTEVGASGDRVSAGQRQRIALARAVFGAPRLVVLDEPSANLDVAAERALARAVQALKRAGATVMVVSHRPADPGQADKVLRLADGAHRALRAARGSPARPRRAATTCISSTQRGTAS